MRIPVGIPLVLAVWSLGIPSAPAETPDLTSTLANRALSKVPTRFTSLNLPPHFTQLIQNRATIDAFLVRELEVESGAPPTPVIPRSIRNRHSQGVRLLNPTLPPTTREFRDQFPKILLPNRGFRAPILDAATNWSAVLVRTNQLSAADHEAQQLINRRLAFDGLLSTLAQVLELLGPASFVTNQAPALVQLNALGFPDDLLACFASRKVSEPTTASLEVVHWIARELLNGKTASSLAPELAQRPFHVPRSWAEFEIASESGGQELRRLRLQLGGGFADGIIPGDSIHVIAQLITGLPQVDALISVPEEIMEPVQLWASQALPLRRPGQVTLIGVSGNIETWAQDNGKAGLIREPANGRRIAGAVTPRYASRQEGTSYFLPSESFVVDGLPATGLPVVHFPLLFQGGNLMTATDPSTGRRTLLLGEGELHRNVALGLRPEQIVEIFRQGFGVDTCVVMPAVSYHLDFDVCVREVGGELVAFVNDPLPAVQAILGLGLDALQRHGLLKPLETEALRYDLSGNNGRLALDRLSDLLATYRNSEGVYSGKLAALFKLSAADSGAGNLQVFLQALKLLESEVAVGTVEGTDNGPAEAMRALRDMDIARTTQLDALAKLGWRVVKVPSLPNFYRGINYLNGIHHRDGYIMPAYGGFYSQLDAMAERVFRQELGPAATILAIQCAELQRKHGAVHCAAVAYPPSPAQAAADFSPSL